MEVLKEPLEENNLEKKQGLKWFTSLLLTTEKFKCTSYVRNTTIAHVFSLWKARSKIEILVVNNLRKPSKILKNNMQE